MQSMTAGTHGPAMVVRSRSSNKVGPGVLPPGQQVMYSLSYATVYCEDSPFYAESGQCYLLFAC